VNLKRPVVLALLAHVYLSQAVSAQPTNWMLSGGGDWNTASNWSAGVPTFDTIATFTFPTFQSGELTSNNVPISLLGLQSTGTGGPTNLTITAIHASGGPDTVTISPLGINAIDSNITINGFVRIAGSQDWAANNNSTIAIHSLTIAPGNGNSTLTNNSTGTGAILFGAGGMDLSSTTSNLAFSGAGRFGISQSQTWIVSRQGHATQQSITFNNGTNLDLGTGRTLTLSPHKFNTLPMDAIVLNSRIAGSSTLRISPTRPAGSGDEDAVGNGIIEIGGTQANVNTGPIIVDGGTLYLRKAASTAGNSLTLNGGQVLIQAGITNALPATTNLVMTGRGFYNRGMPAADGAVTNAPTAHTQTFASVNFQTSLSGGVAGEFITGASTITVTGTFTAAGSGQLRVTPGGTMTVGRLDMPTQPSFGQVVITSGTTETERGTLIIGAGGLNMNGRQVQLTSPTATNFGSILLLQGNVSVTADSSIVRTGFGAHEVQLAGQRTFTVAQNVSLSTTVPHTNPVGTSGGIRKDGPGTMWFEATGSYNGSLQVAAGRFVIASNPFTGNGTAIPDSAFVWIQGGQLSTAGRRGVSGGPNGAGISEQAGPLVVQTATSSIELGTGAHVLSFTALSGGGGVTFPDDTHLTIFGWQGTAGSAGTAGRLVFGTDAGFTPDILSRITFNGYSTGAELITYMGSQGNFELIPVPVPEPTTILGFAAVGLAAIRLRNGLRKRSKK
jgi:hypothetical protein